MIAKLAIIMLKANHKFKKLIGMYLDENII